MFSSFLAVATLSFSAIVGALPAGDVSVEGDGLTTVTSVPTPGTSPTATSPYTTTYTMVSTVSGSLQSVVTTQTVYGVNDNTAVIGTNTGVQFTTTLPDSISGTAAPGSSSDNTRRNAAIAGGVVGGVALLIILVVLILRSRNKKSTEHWRNKNLDWRSAPTPGSDSTEAKDLPYDGRQPVIVRPQPAMRTVA